MASAWETHRDDRGNLRFGLQRPGKKYTIHVLFDENLVRVEETRTGFWDSGQVTSCPHEDTVLSFYESLGCVHRAMHLGGFIFRRLRRLLLDSSARVNVSLAGFCLDALQARPFFLWFMSGGEARA